MKTIRVPINTFIYHSTEHSQQGSLFNAIMAEGVKHLLKQTLLCPEFTDNRESFGLK